MAHAELFMDVHGGYRWLAIYDEGRAEASPDSFATAEEAYAAALELPMTIVADVREGDEIRQISYEEALATRPQGESGQES